MTEEIQVAEQQEIDYKSLYEKAQNDLQAVAKKKDELLNETKVAKKAKEEATMLAQRAEQEKAAKDGEFEKLWQTAENNRKELEQKLLNMQKANRAEKVQVNALKIASELAEGDNVELLSDFISRNLDKLAEDDGTLSVDVIKATKEEFANNMKFKSLLRGSKAAGGGATGNTSSAQVKSNTTDRATFDGWNSGKQMEFIKSGGKLVDKL